VSEGGVIRGVSFECAVPTKFHEQYVDVVLDSEKPLVSHGNVDSMNCDIDSLQDKTELLLNTGVATIQQSVSKSPVEVANSLLHGLQIDTSPARNSLFHSKSDDIESGIAIAMSFASPQASITHTQVVDKSLGPSTIDLKNRKKWKAVEDDTLPLVVKVDDAVQSFYDKYICKNGVRSSKATKQKNCFSIPLNSSPLNALMN